MTDVPQSGGPDYRNVFMVKHDTHDKWVVVAPAMKDGHAFWAPLFFVEGDKIDAALTAAQAGYGTPRELTMENTRSTDPNVANDLVRPFMSARVDLDNWVAREAYDKLQELASTPLGQDPGLTPEEVAKLHDEAEEMLERATNPLKGSLEEQIADLESTLRAQYALEDQAAEVVQEFNMDSNKSEADKEFARTEYQRQCAASEQLENRLDLLEAASEGLLPMPKTAPYAGVDDEQLVHDNEAGLDALAKAVADHGPNGPEPDDPEAQAEPAKPNRPTGPSDSGAEIDVPEYEAGPAPLPTEHIALDMPNSGPRPGQPGSASHQEAMDFANARLQGGTPISQIAANVPTWGGSPTDIAARAFPDAHAATERTARIQKTSAKPKALVKGKVLKKRR